MVWELKVFDLPSLCGSLLQTSSTQTLWAKKISTSPQEPSHRGHRKVSGAVAVTTSLDAAGDVEVEGKRTKERWGAGVMIPVLVLGRVVLGRVSPQVILY